MGFYNVNDGDARYLKQLADAYTIATIIISPFWAAQAPIAS